MRKKKEPVREIQTEREVRGFNRLSRFLHALLKRGMSNMRLSLTFRISLHYCWQLARSAILILLVGTLCVCLAQHSRLRHAEARILALPPDAGESYTQLIIQDSRVSAEAVADRMPEGWWDALRYRAASLFDGSFSVTLLREREGGELIRIRYSLREAISAWVLMALGILVSDLVRMLYFIRRRGRLDRRVLAPIRDITEMAATLSANNLSNRINVAGTKNELQDLAVVINSMLDRIERSYNSQKQFVSDASHELRTPIAVIQGYTDMLRRWGKDDPAVLEEGINAISQETANMKSLVENLLFLARHDKKTLMMEMSMFDPCDLLGELHREAEMVTPQDHFVLEPMNHCEIEADRGMVKQVMRILLDNAVKYTPEGGTVTMGVEAAPEGCILTVRDNGPGISEADLPKIFDRFYRADSARHSETGGHGLGLSIARIIVVAHGGKIRVRSKLGQGSVFSVRLPYRQQAERREPAGETGEEQGTLRILRPVRKWRLHRRGNTGEADIAPESDQEAS